MRFILIWLLVDLVIVLLLYRQGVKREEKKSYKKTKAESRGQKVCYFQRQSGLNELERNPR